MMLRLTPVPSASLSISTTSRPLVVFREPAVELRVCIAGRHLMQARRARHVLLHAYRIRHLVRSA